MEVQKQEHKQFYPVATSAFSSQIVTSKYHFALKEQERLGEMSNPRKH